MSLKEFEDFIDNQPIDDYIVRLKQRYDSDTKWEYINTLLLYGDDAEPYYHWNDDWWEGQQHVEILGYIGVSDLNERSFNSLRKEKLMNQAFTEWIEPKNQRPEEDKEVLVTYKYDTHIGLEIATMKYEAYKDLYYWKTENDFLDYLLDTEVLAWQPLPKPFMEGEEE